MSGLILDINEWANCCLEPTWYVAVTNDSTKGGFQ